MEEESLKNFINSIIFLVKLFAGLKDKFLAQKLYDKISGFIAGYIRLVNSKEEEDETMSHNIIAVEFKNSINDLLEFLDYLEHSKSVSTTPLLYARKNILNFKLDLLKLHHQPIQTVPKSKENKPPVPIPKNTQLRNLKESSNKEKIFNFIKHSPNSRTKEIIEEFNILSERTVKRNLKELTTEGLVRKFAKDKGVYYSTI
jgi:hypothetical protein